MCDETIVLGIPCEQCGADSEEPEFFEHDDEWNVLEEETGAELEMALCHGCGAPGEECSCPTGEKEAMACGTCGRDRADCRCRELYEQKPTKPRERLSLIIDRIRNLTGSSHEETVRTYLALERDEEATLASLGVMESAQKKRVRSSPEEMSLTDLDDSEPKVRHPESGAGPASQTRETYEMKKARRARAPSPERKSQEAVYSALYI
eukprot:gene6552-1773_t